MRLAAALPLIAGLALAACGSKSSIDAKNESPESVASQVAASDIRMQPGQWQSNFKMEKFEMEGMPPAARQAMESAMGAAKQFTTCLTPEEAAKPKGDFLNRDSGCTYEHFTMSGGNIDAKLVCKGDAGERTMTMAGSYTPTDYQVRMTSQGQMMPGKAMNMTVSITSHRTGECTGKEKG